MTVMTLIRLITILETVLGLDSRQLNVDDGGWSAPHGRDLIIQTFSSLKVDTLTCT